MEKNGNEFISDISISLLFFWIFNSGRLFALDHKLIWLWLVLGLVAPFVLVVFKQFVNAKWRTKWLKPIRLLYIYRYKHNKRIAKLYS